MQAIVAEGAAVQDGPQLDADDVVAGVQRSVLTVRSGAGMGSGTAWTADGLVVTNHHVVPQGDAQVETSDGKTYPARVVARNEERDLALLRVDGATLAPVTVRRSVVPVGEMVFAVGNPWGRRGEVTSGIITAIEAPPGLDDVGPTGAIYADVRLAPGNSGGPLVDVEGRVIGINSMIAFGMAVASPSSAVEELVAGKSTQRGALGFEAVPVLVPEFGTGLLASDVPAGSAAAQAGLVVGDIVLAIDGAGGDLRAFRARLERLVAGTAVRLDILRGGAPREVQVTPAAGSIPDGAVGAGVRPRPAVRSTLDP